MRRAVLVTVAVLVFATPAKADHGPPVTGRHAQSALHIAKGYWGADKPCAHLAWGLPPDTPPALAVAELDGCAIWLDLALWRSSRQARRCETMIHEYGHLLGHVHTSNGGIMDTLRVGVPPACRPTRPKGRAFTALRVRRDFRLWRTRGGPG